MTSLVEKQLGRMLIPRKVIVIKARFPLGDFFRANKQNSECDWLVMSSVFVASQSHSFFACSREKIRPVENGLKGPHTPDAIRQRGAIFCFSKFDKFALWKILLKIL